MKRIVFLVVLLFLGFVAWGQEGRRMGDRGGYTSAAFTVQTLKTFLDFLGTSKEPPGFTRSGDKLPYFTLLTPNGTLYQMAGVPDIRFTSGFRINSASCIVQELVSPSKLQAYKIDISSEDLYPLMEVLGPPSSTTEQFGMTQYRWNKRGFYVMFTVNAIISQGDKDYTVTKNLIVSDY